jgi:hypothetical protein
LWNGKKTVDQCNRPCGIHKLLFNRQKLYHNHWNNSSLISWKEKYHCAWCATEDKCMCKIILQ